MALGLEIQSILMKIVSCINFIQFYFKSLIPVVPFCKEILECIEGKLEHFDDSSSTGSYESAHSEEDIVSSIREAKRKSDLTKEQQISEDNDESIGEISSSLRSFRISSFVPSERKGPYHILVRKPEEEPYIQPAPSFSQVKSMTETIVKALDSAGIMQCFPITAYALPAIATGQNIGIIGKPGKTYSSVIGVMNHIFSLNQNEVIYKSI